MHEGHNIILNASSMLEIEAKHFCFKTNPTGPFAITQWWAVFTILDACVAQSLFLYFPTELYNIFVFV